MTGGFPVGITTTNFNSLCLHPLTHLNARTVKGAPPLVEPRQLLLRQVEIKACLPALGGNDDLLPLGRLGRPLTRMRYGRE